MHCTLGGVTEDSALKQTVMGLPAVCEGRGRGAELTPGKAWELGSRLITSEAKLHAPCVCKKRS